MNAIDHILFVYTNPVHQYWLKFSCIVAAVWLGLLTLGSPARGENADNAVPERIEAKAFLVKDAAGYLWGFLGMDTQANPEPSLMLNPTGKSGLIVALQDNALTPSHVVLNLNAGKQFIELGNNDKWGSFLHLTDVAGNLRVGLATNR